MRVFIIVLTLLNFLIASGQQPENADISKIKYGLLLGFNQNLPGNIQTGISIGLTEDYLLVKKFYFQPQAMLTFLPNGNAGNKIVSNIVEIPLHLLYMPTNGKTKPVISAGTSYKYDLSHKSLGWFGEIGLGFEKQLKNFIVQPELRYSYSKSMQILYIVVILKE